MIAAVAPAVVLGIYVLGSVAAMAWVFHDTRHFDFRESRVAHTRAGWAFGTLVALPLVWPLYRRARRTAPPRGSRPRRRRRADRHEWIAFAIVGLPAICAWAYCYWHDSGLQFLMLGLLACSPPCRVAVARWLRGGPLT